MVAMTIFNCPIHKIQDQSISFVSVPEYDVTHPYQSTSDGEFLTHDMRSIPRVRRDAESSDDHHFSLRAFGKAFHLKLRENKELTAPGLMVESFENGQVKRTPLVPSTHYLGHVRDHPESNVAVSNNGALVRFVVFNIILTIGIVKNIKKTIL